MRTFFFVSLVALLHPVAAAANVGPFPGQAAPSFSLPDVAGHTVTLPEVQRGASTVILHFWGTT